MVLLLASVVLARDVVVVGERYAAASLSGWPGVLVRCLDEARPGAFAVADASSPGPSFADMRRALEVAPADAVVIVAVPPPKRLGVFDRVGWRRALAALLEGAAGRTVLLFGPWPAARVLVAQTGSMPGSAIGIRDSDPGWVAAGEVAAQVGVRHVPWEGPEARAAEALIPPARSGLEVDRGPWVDVPRTDAVTLGRLACGAVLGVRVAD